MRKTPLAGAISSILAAGAFYSPGLALAQDDEAEDQRPLEEVIVTGSRIRKDVFTSSAPMEVIDIGEASIQGIANIGQLLQGSSAAAGSPQVTAATSFQFVTDGGLGAQTISLRGLGANRTLVLLNGRRAGPAGVQGATSSFDLNVLPLATIERVEILNDGASSIYGSDAVAGVVNIITRKDDGLVIDGFVSLPQDSGGEESRLSASWGKSFNRGRFRITGDYSKQAHLRRGERDYFNCGHQYIFDTNTGERADIVDPQTGQFHCEDLTWGHVWLYDYADPSNIPSSASLLSQFDYNGDLGQYVPPYASDPNNPSWLTAPAGFFPVGFDRDSDAVVQDDHPFQDQESLWPDVELMTFYADAEFQVTEKLTAYAEVLLNRRTTKSDGYRQYWSYIYSGDHSFDVDPFCVANPDDPDCPFFTMQPVGGNSLSAAAGWNGAQWYSPTAITDHNDEDVEVDYQRFVVGLQGDITDRWGWDLAFQYSRSDGTYTNERIFADSIFDQNWLFGSCEGTTTSVRGVPCVDVPWLDPQLLAGNVSQEVRDFLFGVETGNTEYTQMSVDGFVTGQAFELPAGPLSIAAGFHYRDDEIRDVPGEITFNPGTGESNSWLDDAAGITEGDDSTVAVFGEVDIPVLTDRPGFENLTLNASARWTDVDSYGDDVTWKVGLNWEFISSMRLRANRGTSFRAPALYELFLANQTSSISQRSDPCIDYEENFQNGVISQNVRDNCAADPAGLPPDYTGGTITPTVFTGGGAGLLEAETSDSKTIGLIWQPAFADLSLSVDYFDIEVKDEVDQLGGAQIISSCYESDFGFAFGNTEPLCQLFDRSSVNDGIDNIRDSFINIARQRNRGYDFAGRYLTETRLGSLSIDLKATRQVEDVQALFEDTAEDFNGRIGDPEWVGESQVTLLRDNWQFFWGMDYIGTSNSEEELGGSIVTYRGVDYRAVRFTEAVYYHAFSVAYRFDTGLTLLGGVANAFDEAPPRLTLIQSGNEYTMVGNALLASQYDPIGRRYFVNLTYTFE